LGAIALIAGGAYLLYRNWSAISKFFSDFWEKWSTGITLVATIVGGPLTAAFVAWGIAMMATPIGWIVAGIAAIAAGAYLIIKYWEPIKKFFIGVWDVIKRVKDAVGFGIGGGFELGADVGAGKFGGPGGILPNAGIQRSQAAVSVSFENAPRGMRVKADSRNTTELDLSLGYGMTEALP
jgi:hypothetical protein